MHPHQWQKMFCQFCGCDRCYISIRIGTGMDSQQYPYSETDYCEKCWIEYGIKTAWNHNNESKASSAIDLLKG